MQSLSREFMFLTLSQAVSYLSLHLAYWPCTLVNSFHDVNGRQPDSSCRIPSLRFCCIQCAVAIEYRGDPLCHAHLFCEPIFIPRRMNIILSRAYIIFMIGKYWLALNTLDKFLENSAFWESKNPFFVEGHDDACNILAKLILPGLLVALKDFNCRTVKIQQLYTIDTFIWL